MSATAATLAPQSSLFGKVEAPEKRMREEQERQAMLQGGGPWLHAWHDPVANVRAMNSCARLADLSADGEHKLIVADMSNKLKVYRGTGLASEHALLDCPCAMAVFYPDKARPQIPSVAVAAGPYIFIYRNMRPYYKFSLPNVEVDEREQVVWNELKADDIDAVQAVGRLKEARDAGVSLTARSLDLLAKAESLNVRGDSANRVTPSNKTSDSDKANDEKKADGGADAAGGNNNNNSNNNNNNSSSDDSSRKPAIDLPPGVHQLVQYASSIKRQPIVQLTVVTCMETLKKSQANDPRGESMLVVGTEQGQLLIMDKSGTSINTKVQLPSVPVFIKPVGLFDVDYRVVVVCRDGRVYQVKKGKVIGTVIHVDSQPCGLTVIGKNIIVACMDSVVHAFHFKGKKSFSLYMPSAVTCINSLDVVQKGSLSLLLIALADGTVRMYNGKSLIHSLVVNEVVSTMATGPYSREEAALVLICKSGALSIKLLKRLARLDAANALETTPAEQDIPLRIPQKTKLFVEQTQREREQAVDMHSIFQRDLCKLRLSAARSFVKVISDGQGPMSSSKSAALRLDAQVRGLGPSFLLKLVVKNSGTKPIINVPITFAYDHEVYALGKSLLQLPVLLPGLSYEYEVPVTCIVEDGVAGQIRIFICNPKSALPALSAVVNMPVPSSI